VTLEKQRQRTIYVLFGGNALASTAYMVAVAITAIVAKEITGSAALAGVPAAGATAGVAFGSAWLSTMSRRIGRRPAFSLGYGIAAAGAAVGPFAVAGASIALLTFGMFVLGVGRSVSALSRYAAGDMRTSEKRASAISFVVWASTIGSVAGRYLVTPAGRFGQEVLNSEFSGQFAFTAIGFAIASLTYFLLLRPDPMAIGVDDERVASDGASGRPFSELIKLPNVQLGLTTLIVSQSVMTVLMVMAPIHARDNGHSIDFVALVLMVHTLGMFSFSPLVGFLVEKFSARRAIWVAAMLLVASGVLATQAPNAERGIFLTALFLVGLGWNFGFVAGATVLQESLTLDDRVRVQGATNATVWITAGTSAALSGLVIRSYSYGMLGLIGAILSLLPIIVLLVNRSRVPGPSN
jgi:predicted MFS family arabinose efflux permease